MTAAPVPTDNISLAKTEFWITLLAVTVPFAIPRLGFAWFRRIEIGFGWLARRRGLAVLTVYFSELVLRLVCLPVFPIPLPFTPDDFSYLLSADTFAAGRLANPTPAMWQHFESIHVSMTPTYGSMYFPAPGLMLACGKVLFGHPWFGLLCINALMCAAICWALQAWLPPGWALLAGLISILRIGLFSYWINSYTGGAAIGALGGALVLGALPRLMKSVRIRDGFMLGLGAAILALSRPYEGLLLCLPVAFVLGRWLTTGDNRPSPSVLLRRSALPMLVIVAGLGWLGYYDYHAFGSPTTLPYTANRAMYAVAPYWGWQPLHPVPEYRHAVMRDFYMTQEVPTAKSYRTFAGFVGQNLARPINVLRFFAGIALLPPLFMLRRVIFDRRVRFMIVAVLVLMTGMLAEIFLIPHYVAPFTVAFYAIGLQATRHLRVWRSGGKPVGMTMVRLIVLVCVLLAGLRLFARPYFPKVTEWPVAEWMGMWYGPDRFGTVRESIKSQLETSPGGQLAIVRYSPKHNPLDEWVYNSANIDDSKVVWAREMDHASNLDLIRFYNTRKVWLVQPDSVPAEVTPYPVSDLPATH